MKRRIIQIISFIFFTIFLSRLIYEHLPGYIIALSPTLHLGNMSAIIRQNVSILSIIPSFILIAMGVLLYKRWFCFNLCPLGFLQDILPSFNKQFYFLRKILRCNYYIFIVLFLLSLFFINMLGLFDPLVIYARFVNAFQKSFPHYYEWFLVLLMGITISTIFSRRMWCYYVCPLGAFFDGCSDLKARLKKIEGQKVDLTRRNVLITSFGGLIFSLGLKYVRSSYAKEDLIRPPGALNEERFKDMCIRCGNCIKACITNGLQPTLFEGGWDGMFTPRLVSRIGECDEYCNRCGISCPTGAIRPLPLAKKRNLQLGIAHVDRSICLGWTEDQLCFICGEFCPYLALERYMKDGRIPCPIVREDVCRGCGLCEKQCPTHAIKVYRKEALEVVKQKHG